MEEQAKPLQVNIRAVLAKKAPEKARKIPGFVYRILERIIHQDDINGLLARYGDRKGVSFASGCLEYLGATVQLHGLEALRQQMDGRACIFVSNHPLGGFDGLTLIAQIGSHLGPVRFVVNDILMHIKPLEDVFVPVNKHGRQSADYVHRIDEAYGSRDHILYFPAGLCSRRIKGKVRDLPWHKNVVQKAILYNRPIVPVFFSEQNSRAFYALANWRKRLGIKFNVEMLFLPHEMFKKKNVHFHVYLGTPVGVEELRQGSPTMVTQKLRSMVYALPFRKD